MNVIHVKQYYHACNIGSAQGIPSSSIWAWGVPIVIVRNSHTITIIILDHHRLLE